MWIICIFKRKHTVCDKSTANNPWQPCGLLDTVSKRPRLAWTTSGLEQDFKLWWQWLHMAIKMDFWWSMLYQSSTLVNLWKLKKKIIKNTCNDLTIYLCVFSIHLCRSPRKRPSARTASLGSSRLWRAFSTVKEMGIMDVKNCFAR